MTSLVVNVSDEELLGLQALSRLHETVTREARELEEMAGALVRRAIALELDAASLPWAPAADVVDAHVQSTLTLAAQAEEVAATDVAMAATLEERLPRTAPSSRFAAVLEDPRVRRAALGASLAAVAIALIGGYVGHWSWTGFGTNNQVWDWLQLLLLPVAIGTFPLWLQYAEHMSAARKATFAAGLLAFVGFVVAGYLVPISWTGFPGNTLWNWLTLIALPVTVATLLAWPASPREIRRSHVIVICLLVTAWVVTLVGGYGDNWRWTGYEGNTLWDWVELLLAPGALATILFPSVVRWASGDVERRALEARARAEQGSSRRPAGDLLGARPPVQQPVPKR